MAGLPWGFEADGATFRLTSEAYRIHLAYLFDLLIAVHTSLVEPLPRQITAVYETMRGKQPLRFLLADDPGAGKTIMTGLLIKELLIRGDLRHCLIVSQAISWSSSRMNSNNAFNLPSIFSPMIARKLLLGLMRLSRCHRVSHRGPNGEAFAFSWSSDLAVLLNRLHPITPLPSLQHIKDNPQQYIHRSQKRGSLELEAAIVYRPNTIPSHKIGTGMMLRDLFEFAGQLAAALEPELVFTYAYQRLIGIQKHANPFFPTALTKKESLQETGGKESLTQLQMERLLALGRGAAQVTIEIWWQSAEMLQALRQAMHELFGYPLDKENGYVVTTPEVSLTVQSQPLGFFGAALQVASGSRETFYDRYRDAFMERVELQPLLSIRRIR